MICKTPEELLAYDQGVLDERERLIALLDEGGRSDLWLTKFYLKSETNRFLMGGALRSALTPK